MNNKMTQTFKPNTQGYQVLTPNGFKDFSGVSLMGVKAIIRLEFENDCWIECTHDHKLYVTMTLTKPANEMNIGDSVVSSKGNLKLLKKIDLQKTEPVYDLIEVDGGHRYFANSLLSSNCEFIVYGETLINALRLADMKGIDPILKAGQVRYYSPVEGNKTYVLGWDPSLGTGGDNAAIQVFQLPEMTQVAEWQHNKTDIKSQLKIIRDILAYIDYECKQKKQKVDIYWSVENNTIGEAALLAIRELGEENIPGTFLSEPGKKRKGFSTTHSTKIASCSKLKYWIESNKLKLLSKNLIRELKNFVAAGQSFAAKTGETDDLVMSTILCVRQIQLLTQWDQGLFDRLQDDVERAEIVMPMPIAL